MFLEWAWKGKVEEMVEALRHFPDLIHIVDGVS